MKIKLDIDNNCILGFYDILGSKNTNRGERAIIKIMEAIEKAKNQIKPGDVIKEAHTDFIIYGIACYQSDGNKRWRTKTSGFPFDLNARKVSPEEENIIRPLLEMKGAEND